MLLAGLTAPARAQEDPDAERDDVRNQQNAVDGELDVLHATDAEVGAELTRLEGELASARDGISQADAGLAAAEVALARHEHQITVLEERLAAARADVEEVAVMAYIHPPGDEWVQASEGGGDMNDVLLRRSLLLFDHGDSTDLVDEFRRTEQELQRTLLEVEEARVAAERYRRDAAESVASLETAAAEQATLAAQVDDRINASLAEAAALEELDAELSAEIRTRQEELALQAALAAQAKAEAEAAAASKPAPGPAAQTNPTPVVPVVDVPVPSLPSVPGGLTTVGGITVSNQIAGQLRSMLSAAAAGGISLGGNGYRDPQQQIELRKQNCGTSNYAIYEMDPTRCTPETARPGSSKHEVGLAIDFTYNGQIIRSRSNPGFVWLAANAGSYGFANLPSEPWHWSPGGL